MSFSVNEVFLAGNVGTITKADGHTRFGLCTNYTNKDNENVATWHNIICVGQQKEFVDRYLEKGKGLWVRGRLTYRAVEDAKYCNIFASQVQFTQNKKHESATQEPAPFEDQGGEEPTF